LYVRRRYLLDHWSGKDFCLGKDIRGVVPSGFGSLHIDSPLDLETARSAYKIMHKKSRNFVESIK